MDEAGTEQSGEERGSKAEEAAAEDKIQTAIVPAAAASTAVVIAASTSALLSSRFLESCLRCARPLQRDLWLSSCGHSWHPECCEDWRGCIACDASALAAPAIDPRIPSKGRLTAQAALRARHLSDTNDELDRLFAPEESAAAAAEDPDVTVIDAEESTAVAATGAAGAGAAQGTAILRANLGNRARNRRTRAATDDDSAAAAAAAAAAPPAPPRSAAPASALSNGGVSSNLFRLYFNPQDVLDALFASSSASQSQSASAASQAEDGEDVSALTASTDVALKMEFLARKRRKHSELLGATREMHATVLEYTASLSRLRRETEVLQEKTATALADTKRYRTQESKQGREAYKIMLGLHSMEAEIRTCIKDMVELDRTDKTNRQAWMQRASQRSISKQSRGGTNTARARRLQAMEGLGLSAHLQSTIDAEAAADDEGGAEPDDPLAVQSADDAQLSYAVPHCYTTLPDLLSELLKDLLHIDPALIYDVAARVAALQNNDEDQPGSFIPAATARHVAGRIDLMELGLDRMESLMTPRMLEELTKVARQYPELGQVADQIAGIESAASAAKAAAAETAAKTAETAMAEAIPMETEQEGMPALEEAGTQALRSSTVAAPAAAASAPILAPAAPGPAPILSLLHLPLPPPIEVTDALLTRVRTQGRSLQSDLHRLVYDEMSTLRHSLASARQGLQRAKAVEDKALRAERNLKDVTRRVDKLDAEIAQLEETLNRRTRRPAAPAAAAASAPAASQQRVHKRIRLDDDAAEDVTLLLSDEGGDSPERAARRRASAPSSAASSSSAPAVPLAAAFPSLYPQSFRPSVHAPSAVAAAAPSSKPLRTNLLAASSSASSSAVAAAATAVVGVAPPVLRPAPGQGGKAKLAAAFDLMSSLGQTPSDSSGPLLATLNLSNLREIAAQAAMAPPPPAQPPRENPFGLKTSASPAAVPGAVPHSLHSSSVPSDRPLASLCGLSSLSGAPALSVRDRAAANARKGKSAGGEYMVRGPDGRGGSVTVMRTEEEVQRERAKRLRSEKEKQKENGAAAAAAAASAAPAKLSRQSSASSPTASLFSMPNLAFRPGVHGTANQHARVHKPSQSSSPAAAGGTAEATAARVHTIAIDTSSPGPAAAAAAGSPSTAPPPAMQRSTSTPAPHTLAAAFSRAAAASTSSSSLSRSASSRQANRAARPASAASSSAVAAAAARDVVVIDSEDDDEVVATMPTAHPFFSAAKSATAAAAAGSVARSNSRTPFSAVQPQAK